MTYRSKEPIKCLMCDKASVARKLCKPHYYQVRRKGLLDNFSLLTPEDVFDSKYTKLPNGCWEWNGTKNGYGYGIFLLPGEIPVRAHRYSYERSKGAIPDGMIVMHMCDNPPCINPKHLRVGTKAENNRDAAHKMRNSFGEKNGHSKLTTAQIIEIRNSPVKQSILAKIYNVNQSQISKIKAGTRRSKG